MAQWAHHQNCQLRGLNHTLVRFRAFSFIWITICARFSQWFSHIRAIYAFLLSHHTMQTYGRMEVQFHMFLTSDFSFRHLTNIYSVCSEKKAWWVRKFRCRKQNICHNLEATHVYWVVQPIA